MKLYTRKLHNVEDLEVERKKLLKKKKKMDKEPILALDTVLSTAKKDKETHTNSLLSFLPISAPVLTLITGILKRKLFTPGPATSQRTRERLAAEDHVATKSIAQKVIVDVVGSYLKWKAIELSYKGAKKVIKNQQRKKAEQKARQASRAQAGSF